ncbi:hypothetical protein PYW07_000783 [Mythimna separata]|uniref:Regulatory protein zeste n=1 Tax=Mythimna separata TaxID=271217 RepID=A0AAD8DW98_MYTSE|nr:hypothetical protein PYW07_000783 [Mythimna separata]
MEEKKQRTANFTNYEKALLTELVMKYKDIVENKRTDATSNVQKAAGWKRLTKEFNRLSSNINRTPRNIKICWENIKRATKKQVSKKETFITGEEKPQATLGNDSTIVFVEAVPGAALESLSNTYDRDQSEWSENEQQLDDKESSMSSTEEPEKTHHNKKKESWETWTPKYVDVLLKETIGLVKIFKRNAEEEGNLRILILKEQLKQEQLKTEKLKTEN